MRSPRDFLIELLASFLWDGAKYAGGTLLLGASVYVIKNRNRPWLEELPKHSIALAFILGAFGVCLLTLAVYRTLRYSPPLPKQDYDFDQMDRCITFEYHSLERYTYRKRIVLRARRSGLSIFTDKYRWTGKIQPHVKSGIKGQSVHPTDRKSVWQFYEIRFPKTLKKGEQVETDLIFELSDPEHSFVPFISTSIEEPTKKLGLTLEVPPEFRINQVFCETSSCIGARVPFETEVKSFGENGMIKWDPLPRMHFHYEMRWETPKVSSNG